MTKDFFDELDNELSGVTPENPTPKSEPKAPQKEAQTDVPPQPSAEKPLQNASSAQRSQKPTQNQRPQNSARSPHNRERNPNQRPQQNKQRSQNGDTPKSDRPKNNFRKESQAAFNPVVKSQFPQVKFFLPPLRENFTRVIPVGGNNETGAKNMDMFQFNDDIVLVDCGIQFAEPDMLGVTCSVPDISFLIPYKKNIKALIVTHAHLDHIGALKHILPALDFPVIYATKLTIGIVKK